MGVSYQLLTTLLTQSNLYLFLASLSLVYLVRYILYLRSLPPGPYGLPFLGSLANFKKAFYLQMFDYARQFGHLVSIKMGSQLIVIINDANLLRRTFARSELTARPRSALDSVVEGYGLITTDGALWQSQRRFIHKNKFGLKFWGNVSEQMETRVTHEVLDCLNELVKEGEGALDPSPFFSCSISNVICSIIMSTRFKHHTERFKRFINFFDEGFRLFTLTGAMIFLPILRFIPNMTKTCTKLKQNRAELLKFVGEIVDEHRETINPKSPRDLVDLYLTEIQRSREEDTMEQDFQMKDPEVQLQQVLVDLFSAGFETVKTTLLWTLLHMLRNPQVKAKVQEELEREVGSTRLPCMEDMERLPYTRAVVYESMRRTTAVPMGTTHSNKRPVWIEGHLIPSNSHIIPNLYAMNMDPTLWDQPEEFVPERFLSEDGKSVLKPRHFLPFGTGQRMCLGAALAETELQLFFSSFLHVFDIEAASETLPSLEGNFGATLTPDSFQIKLIHRNVEALIAANNKAKPLFSGQMRVYG